MVIGNIGRLSYQKNHEFLVKVFNKIHQKNSDARLVLIGVGEKEEKIRNQVDTLNLSKFVQFLGNRNDVANLYNVFDVFVMPSLFEGIPVVGIEAQFAGLPIVFSDRVPKEVAFTDQCKFISLDESVDEWANIILKERKIESNNISNSLYNIKNAVPILENYYVNLYKQILD